MNEFLMVARRTDLRQISLDVPYYADVQILPDNIQKAIAVDVDVIESESLPFVCLMLSLTFKGTGHYWKLLRIIVSIKTYLVTINNNNNNNTKHL